MANVEVPLDKAGALFRRYAQKMPSTIRKGLLSASLQAKPIMVKQTDMAPPASPKGSRGAVNTGNYRQAWKSAPGTQGGTQGMRVSNSAPYAGVIEYGRRRGAKMPPIDPIARWAQRKLGLPYPKAKGIAFAIAKAISKRGLQPRRVLTSRTTLDLLLTAMRRDVLHEMIRMMRSTS